MKLKSFALMICFLTSSLLTGCGMTHQFKNPFGDNQADAEGPTLPSGLDSRDHVQYFPTQPGEQPPHMKRALEQYQFEQEQYQLEQQGETTQQ